MVFGVEAVIRSLESKMKRRQQRGSSSNSKRARTVANKDSNNVESTLEPCSVAAAAAAAPPDTQDGSQKSLVLAKSIYRGSLKDDDGDEEEENKENSNPQQQQQQESQNSVVFLKTIYSGSISAQDESYNNDRKPSARDLAGARMKQHQEQEPSSSPLNNRVSFGHFDGTQIYRNRVSEEEGYWDGHYAVDELVIPNCTAALCTSFSPPGVKWLEQIFKGIPNLIVVKPPTMTGSDNDEVPIIGKAILAHIHNSDEQIAQRPQWYWVSARPHTGGCMHSKLLLFRSPQGLRVAVCGGNLTKQQWATNRDVFWVQDFPISDTGGRSNSHEFLQQFGVTLQRYLQDITKCSQKNHQAVVHYHLQALFERIDFSKAQGRLVFSLPREMRSDQDYGGWKQLAQVVDDLLLQRGMRYGSDMEEDEDEDENEDDYDKISRTSTLFATSGSLGNLEHDFLAQMHKAMNGITQRRSYESSWREVEDRVRVLWPSTITACQTDMWGLLGCLRPMPAKHVKTIPEESRLKIFHDAIPNPPTKTTFPGRFVATTSTSDHDKEPQVDTTGGGESSAGETIKLYVATHGKFIYNDRNDSGDCDDRGGVLYVGSHNFSRAAWGLRNQQPKNVELGVVLASHKADRNQAWRSRLPCTLVPPRTQASINHKLYVGLKDYIVDNHPLGYLLKQFRSQQESTSTMAVTAYNNTVSVQELVSIVQGLLGGGSAGSGGVTLANDLTIGELTGVAEGALHIKLHVQYSTSYSSSKPSSLSAGIEDEKKKRRSRPAFEEIITIEDSQML